MAPPVAIFHGMHDNCELNRGLENTLREGLETHAECIEVGNGKRDSILMNFQEQCELACQNLKAHPKFQEDEINVIGFS